MGGATRSGVRGRLRAGEWGGWLAAVEQWTICSYYK